MSSAGSTFRDHQHGWGDQGQGAGFSGDNGTATSAQLQEPVAIATDGAGDLYIADHFNNVVRKVDNAGVITTVAGNFLLGSDYDGDTGPATTAQMYGPNGESRTAAAIFISPIFTTTRCAKWT